MHQLLVPHKLLMLLLLPEFMLLLPAAAAYPCHYQIQQWKHEGFLSYSFEPWAIRVF